MKISEWISRADRVQRSRGFKIAATAVVLVAAVVGLAAYLIAVGRPDARESRTAMVERERAAAAALAGAGDKVMGRTEFAEGAKPTEVKTARPETTVSAAQDVIGSILAAREDPTRVAVGIGLGTGLALVVIWLGLALTYASLLAGAGAIVGPLMAMRGEAAEGVAVVVGGVVILLAAFTALTRLARLLLSGPGAVFAVAKHALDEAVRMKVSMVFIVLLVFGMALLPQILDAGQPLRYRVQTFLAAGMGGSFWLIALLVLVFSISTVTRDQRDKVIWQTMTKPVAGWQYLLGKWLGVSTLAAILLTVCGSAVYLFAGYLRTQPALGERVAFVSQSGPISEDRLLLETQVMTARQRVEPMPPQLDEAAFAANVQQRVQMELERLGEELGRDEFARARNRQYVTERMTTELRQSVTLAFRSVAPGEARVFEFRGLGPARAKGLPVHLRFRPDSGDNRPDTVFRLTMEFAGSEPWVEEVALGQWHSVPLSPQVIDAEGRAFLRIQNGDVFRRVANPATVSFGANGLELSYTAGGFGENFARAYAVMWVKLAFLAMVSIWAGTFLSFPVGCLVAVGVFLSAEGAGFIRTAVQNFPLESPEGRTLILNTITAGIASGVSWVFGVYADLQPSSRVVEGLRLGWGQFAAGVGVLAAWTMVLYAAAVLIFRQRELATYSGNM